MLPQCKRSTSSCEIKLRELEIDSYSKILSVFRARGNLTNDRRKLLKQIGSFLNISQDRHRAEVRRVTNDELLSNIATRVTGQDWTYDWHEEGKRVVPAPTPFSNFTINTPFADYISSVASLGKKYVEMYNKKICNSNVPNECQSSEESQTTSSKTPDGWLNDINKLFESVQKEKSRDVSVQTPAEKVVPKICTYCQRRKELRKKKALCKELEKDIKSDDVSSKLELCPSNVVLPSGKRIVVENTYDDLMNDFSVSIIAQEVVVETEPCAGPSQEISNTRVDPGLSLPSVPSTDYYSGPFCDTEKWESSDASSTSKNTNQPKFEKPNISPRIPRILNSGPRKKIRNQSFHSTMKYPSPVDRIVRRKGQESLEAPCVLIRSPLGYSRPTGGSTFSQQGPRFHRPVPRQQEGFPRHQDRVSKEQIHRPQEVVAKHNVYSRLKTMGPFSEVSRYHPSHHPSAHHHSRNDSVDVSMKYSQERPSDVSCGGMDVIEISDYPIEEANVDSDNQTNKQVAGSSSNLSQDFYLQQSATSISFIPTDSRSSALEEVPTPHNSSFIGTERSGLGKRDYSSRKIVKMFNGEKKVHGTIHFRSDGMKDMISSLPSTQIPQIEVKNGCPSKESTKIENYTTIWAGTNLSGNEFLMESVNEDSSYPIINGHEDVILEEEIVSGNQVVESFADKTGECSIPQTDMKFSVVDLTNYSGPIENLQCVSLQSKEDSRDSDIFVHRP